MKKVSFGDGGLEEKSVARNEEEKQEEGGNLELTLERVPFRPESRVNSWVAELRSVSVDSSGPIDLSEFPFEVGESKAHLSGLRVGEDLDGSLIDGSGGGKSEVGGGLGDVDGEHLMEWEGKSRRASAGLHGR